MQHGSVAPVDLAQASIGPGMAIYSRYSKVVESDGTPMRIRTALQLINRALDEALAEAKDVENYDILEIADILSEHGHDAEAERMIEERVEQYNDTDLLRWLQEH